MLNAQNKAIHAMSDNNTAAQTSFTVDSHADQICCDGGGGPLGHPMVYYTFDGKPEVRCGYCDRHFVKARG